MNSKTIFVVLLLVAVVVAGCQETVPPTGEDDDPFNFTDINVSENETMSTDDEPSEEIDESKASFKLEVEEGELAEIPIKAVDPDGDFLDYTFEDPFNEQGLWQTEIGDEGKYLVKVSVTDGTLTTSEYVLVTVLRANRPPTIECDESITVQETETVELDCNIFDVDGDVVTVGYDGWMKAESKETTFGDAGTYTVVVRARDRTGESFQEVTVNVLKKNRAPVIEQMESIVALETDDIELNPVVSDPDGDEVEVLFEDPFDDDGEWRTTFGDAGTYNVNIIATDGDLSTEMEVEVIVERKNRAPVLKEINPIEVDEGEKVIIPVNAFDPDGDDVTISYSGWMDSSTYTTTFDDAYPDGCDEKGCSAVYSVTVRASDGVLSVTEDVEITVNDRNRPPRFVFG